MCGRAFWCRWRLATHTLTPHWNCPAPSCRRQWPRTVVTQFTSPARTHDLQSDFSLHPLAACLAVNKPAQRSADSQKDTVAVYDIT